MTARATPSLRRYGHASAGSAAPLRIELLKLRRPLLAWLALLGAGVTLLLAFFAVHHAHIVLGLLGPVHVPPCNQIVITTGQSCATVRHVLYEEAVLARRGSLSALAQGRSLESPIGAGATAAIVFATVPGATVAFLLTAAHVAAEWSDRTLKLTLLRDCRRWRFLVRKTVSSWLVVVGCLLLAWLVLALAAPFFHAADPLNGVADPGYGLADVLVALAKATLALAGFTTMGVVVAVVSRSVLGTVVGCLGLLTASFFADHFALLTPFTLPYWVTGLLHLQAGALAMPLLWVSAFSGTPAASTLDGVVGVVALIVTASTVAIAVFSRQDVTG